MPTPRAKIRTPRTDAQIIPNATFTYANGIGSIDTSYEPTGNESTARDIQLFVAARDEPVAIILGRNSVGAKGARGFKYGARFLFVVFWGRGTIDAVESVTINGQPLAASILVTHYLGGQVTADPKLVTAFAALGVTWTAALTGLAYSVFDFPTTGVDIGEPVAIIRGLKAYDPRDGAQSFATPSTWTYTTNPVLLTARVMTDGDFGLSVTPDSDFWASVTTAANKCDEIVSGTTKRRTLNYVLQTQQSAADAIRELGTYCGCWIVPEGASYRFILNAPTASSGSVTMDNMLEGSFSYAGKSTLARSNTYFVRYMEPQASGQWLSRLAPRGTDIPAVPAGETYRAVTVERAGTNSYQEALREAQELRGHEYLEDISMRWQHEATALSYQLGDVRAVSWGGIFTNKLMRIVDIALVRPDRWEIAAKEYDPASYSNSFVTAPSYPDSSLPSPGNPPTIATLTLVEKPVANAPGALPLARIEATAGAVTWPFLSGYRFIIRNSLGELISDATIPTNVYTSAAVPAFDIYTVEAYAVSTIAQSATPRTESITLTASNENSMIEFIGEDISRLQSGASEWLCNGSGGATLFRLWSGDNTVRARSGARVESDVYTGANQLTPGLATQMLDAARTANVVTSGLPPDLDLITGETIPVVTGGFIDLGVQRDIVIGVTNISRWLTLYGDRFIIRWKFGNTPTFGNPPGYGPPPYYQVAYGPNARINGRYVQLEILQRWTNQGSDGFGGTLWAAQTWQIEFENSRIATFLEAFVDTINATTLTTGPLRVQLNRTYSVVKGVLVTPLSSVAANTSYGPVFTDEINVENNYVDINAFDSAGNRVAVPVSIQITGALAL